MLSYKNSVRTKILKARGEVDPNRLTTDPHTCTELDTKIIRLAHRALKRFEKTAFFYAYHCSPSWEEIQMLFATQLHRRVRLDTVQKYGERAALALIKAAPTAPEFGKIMVEDIQPMGSAGTPSSEWANTQLSRMMLNSADDAQRNGNYDLALQYAMAVISVEPHPSAFTTMIEIALSLLSQVSPHTQARTLLERLHTDAETIKLIDYEQLQDATTAIDRGGLFKIARRSGQPNAANYLQSPEVISCVSQIEQRLSLLLSPQYVTDRPVSTRSDWELVTPEVALRVGIASGKLFSKDDNRLHRVVIGKDTRLSGYMIESALMSGFTAAGMNVFLLGPMPIPAMAMLTRSLRADLGAMIGGNGIKLFDADGLRLSDEVESEIEALMAADTESLLAPADRIGRAKRIDSAGERYIEFVKRTLPRGMRLDDLKVVIDCANGAGYQVAPAVLSELGADVIKIGVEPDGHNINRGCGTAAPEALCAKVRKMHADIGIALDGDADRVVIVDENGRIVDGDQIMAVIAENWHRDGKLAAGGVVATVMSNLGFERYLAGLGLKLVRTPVGDRYVIEEMRKHGYNVGGERSGHFILSDYSTTGDGLVAALEVLAVLVNTGRPVSTVCRRFEAVPQLLQSVSCANSSSLEHAMVKNAIDSGKARLGESGRLLVRRSATAPVVRVMAEGDDEVLVRQVVGDVAAALRNASKTSRMTRPNTSRPR